MPATKAKIKDVVADIEAELETLQYRNAQATSGVEEARARLDELAARRGAIASNAYFGDTKATEEIAGLDAESSNLTRVVSLARDAAQSLEGDIADARQRLQTERTRVSKEEVGRLRQERQAVQERALSAADGLLAVLAEDRDAHKAMVQAAQGVDSRTLEIVSQDHDGAGLQRALAEKLRTYAPAWVG